MRQKQHLQHLTMLDKQSGCKNSENYEQWRVRSDNLDIPIHDAFDIPYQLAILNLIIFSIMFSYLGDKYYCFFYVCKC